MATYKHLRSGTANKRPTTSIADGQLAINTNTASPGLFFKDSAGTGIVKVGPVHVGTTAPNSSPAVGGSTGNYLGEQWLDTSVSPAQMKVWNGSTWVGVVADELPVSKLQDGAPRQLIQTDAAGTGVEWTSNVDVPGTLDVTSTATFDSIAQYPLGSAGAPTITFTGDNNTGIYSPGADQVAISTGGSGRLFVGSSGNIGLGTSSPTAFVQSNGSVKINADNSYFTIDADTNDRLGFVKKAGATPIFAAGSATSFIFGHSSGTSISDPTNQTFSERLRITSAGLVGVGTSAPAATFHCVGNGLFRASTVGTQATLPSESSAFSILNGTGYNASPSVSLNIGASNHDSVNNNAGFQWRITTPSTAGAGATLTFNSYSFDGTSTYTTTPRMVITSSGNVGIGTTSPLYPLHVERNQEDLLALVNTGVVTYRLQVKNDASLAVVQNSAERARIDSSGRLGVGTSSPATILDINTSGGMARVGGASGNNLIQAYTGAVGLGMWAGGSPRFYSTGNMTFSVNATIGTTAPTGYTDALTITSAGLVGVGTSSPGATLHIEGLGSTVNQRIFTSDNVLNATASLTFGTTPGSRSKAAIRMINSNTGNAAGDLSLLTDSGSSGLVSRLYIAADGKVGIGTTGPGHALDVVGDIRANPASGNSAIRLGRAGDDRWAIYTDTSHNLNFYSDVANSLRATIDSSGRLLVGASATSSNSRAIIQGSSGDAFGQGILRVALGANNPADGTPIGSLAFTDSGHISAALVTAQRDAGTWASGSSHPTRLVFSTTADGASSPTERLRITNDGVQAYNQPAPAAVNATATLTVANLKAGIITSTSAAATDMTLPTGTDTQAGFSGTYDNFTFEWSVINTGPSLVRVLAATAHTIIGSGSVATGTSGRFASRRTAANTFVTYRLS